MTTHLRYLDLEENSNISKNVLLNFLFQNEYISEKAYNDLVKNYAFIIKKRSFFSKFFNKDGKDDYIFVLVKQVSLRENEKTIEDIINGT